MTQPPEPLVVRRTIPIPRDRVFDAWLDPVRLARFMRPGGTGRATAEVDPRVGGRFRIVMHHPNGPPDGTAHTGEYLVIDRPKRLSFTWRSIHTDDRATTVTIDFLDRGGETEVVLTHAQLPPREIEGHRKGWSDILGALNA
ncbi:MAG TPA: SRPBCC domain-containing protein [Gemmatimonadaceae bacterium]|jgi:uncharacterized protein YndB with AHSA1/START domain